ncbi:RNA exonuclease 1 [Nymphon striatum]|nr:RNA exonuclease 1 [Nymphon striatum]
MVIDVYTIYFIVARPYLFNSVERYVCTIYGYPREKLVNVVRSKLFDKKFTKGGKVIDMALLPPCSLSLVLHIKRANYVAKIWRSFLTSWLDAEEITESGWLADVLDVIGEAVVTSEIGSNVLKVVDDEIRKVEAAVNEEKAKINKLGLTSNPYERPEDLIEYKSCWAVPNFPEYKPTPIRELKKLKSSNGNQHASDSVLTTPYLPQYSYSTSKNVELSYMPTPINSKKSENDDAISKSLSSYVLNSKYSDDHSKNKQKCDVDKKELLESEKTALLNDDKNSSLELESSIICEVDEKQTDTKNENNDKIDSSSHKIKISSKHKRKESSKSSSSSHSKHKTKSSVSDSSKKIEKSSDSKSKKSKHSSHNTKDEQSKDSKSDTKEKKRKHSSHHSSDNTSKKKQKLSSSDKNKSKHHSSSSSHKVNDSNNSSGKKSKESHGKDKKHSKHKKDSSSTKHSKVQSKDNKGEKKKNNNESSKSNVKENDKQSSSLTVNIEEDGANFIKQLGKKRTAHQPSLVRENNEASLKPKISPAEVMHNRFVQLQKSSVTDHDTIMVDFLIKHFFQKKNGNKRSACIPESMMAAIIAKQRKSCSMSNSSLISSTVATTHTKGTKRVAHLPAAASAKRPTIPISFGSKVPSNIRQRYLNIFIDECLKIYPDHQDAFDRALEEEKNAYNRSSNKTVYLNVVVNITKKLRTEIKQEESPKATMKITDFKNPKVSHAYNLGGAQAAKVSFSIERKNRNQSSTELTDALFYEMLKQYLLDEKQLEAHVFPRIHPSIKSQALIFNLDEIKKITSKQYDGDIVSTYSCCQGERESEGCSVCKGHIDSRINVDELHGFVQTIDKNDLEEDLRVYAIDCEMCCSATGMELTRVTVIGRNLETVYETLVKPPRPIIDYNTRFSGITEKDLEGVYTTLENVQSMLLDLFSSKTILIGHSLNSDLLALKMVHDTVVDTSVVFPHRRGLPFKRALRTIMAEFLMKIIQNDADYFRNKDIHLCLEIPKYFPPQSDPEIAYKPIEDLDFASPTAVDIQFTYIFLLNVPCPVIYFQRITYENETHLQVDGHDSNEDARACMELMLWKIKEDLKKHNKKSN